jgi:hypothetical protein
LSGFPCFLFGFHGFFFVIIPEQNKIFYYHIFCSVLTDICLFFPKTHNQQQLSSTLNKSTASSNISSSSGMMSSPPHVTAAKESDVTSPLLGGSTLGHSSSLNNTTSSSSLAVSPNPSTTATPLQQQHQKEPNKSLATTSTAAASSSSSSSLSYTNRTSTSNNSLNQTSFVASPEAPTPVSYTHASATEATLAAFSKEKSPPVPPKPSGSMINSLIATFNAANAGNNSHQSIGERKFELPHHTRKNSMSIIKGGAIVGGDRPSIVSIVNTGSTGNISAMLNHHHHYNQQHSHHQSSSTSVSQQQHQPTIMTGHIHHKSTASISSMKLLQQGGSVDIDNNFINNTFSFLDDLDQDDALVQPVELPQPSSSSVVVVNATAAVINVSSSNQNDDNSDSNNEMTNSNTDYENFPWHAIYPAGDSNSATDSSSQLNLSNLISS